MVRGIEGIGGTAKLDCSDSSVWSWSLVMLLGAAAEAEYVVEAKQVVEYFRPCSI